MDPLERAIEALKRQREELVQEELERLHLIESKVSPGGKKQAKRIRLYYGACIEAIDYVINFCENLKEEPCQD